MLWVNCFNRFNFVQFFLFIRASLEMNAQFGSRRSHHSPSALCIPINQSVPNKQTQNELIFAGDEIHEKTNWAHMAIMPLDTKFLPKCQSIILQMSVFSSHTTDRLVLEAGSMFRCWHTLALALETECFLLSNLVWVTLNLGESMNDYWSLMPHAFIYSFIRQMTWSMFYFFFRHRPPAIVSLSPIKVVTELNYIPVQRVHNNRFLII